MQKITALSVAVVIILVAPCSFSLFNARADPLQDQWPYKKIITIDHTKVAGPLTNYPLLISITDLDLAAKAQIDGDDIYFSSTTGTRYAHEIETYQSSNGRLIAWIKIPSLSNTQNTLLEMHYGNPTCGSQRNVTDVWTSSYLAVHHLNETSGTATDSTSHNNDGMPYGGLTQQATGKIGDADSFDGANDQLRLPRVFTTQNHFTLEAWIYAQTGARYILCQWTSSHGVFLQKSATQNRLDAYLDTTGFSLPLTLNQWNHIALTYDGTKARLYVNAGNPIQRTNNAPTWPNYAFTIGDRYTGGYPFHGIIDEVRLSSTALSQAWLTTQYKNQNQPSSFYTVGPEQSSNQPPFITDQDPTPEATNISIHLASLCFCVHDPENQPISYAIHTHPDIIGGLQTGTTSNGTTLTIPTTTVLQYATSYIWTVNVSDGNTTITTNHAFTTMASPTNGTWLYQKTITINHLRVAGSLTLFPVLVSLTDADLAAHAQPDGDDIYFSSTTGTRYPHEIETYQGSNGRLITWVRIPSLSPTQDTLFQMHYGNPASGPQQTPNDVWDTNFLAVHHLAETSGTAYDSTSHHLNGAPYGGLTQTATGKIGDADYFDGANDQLRLPRVFTTQNHFTLEAWIYAQTGARYILCQWTSSHGVFLQKSATQNRLDAYLDTTGFSLPLTLNQWNHIALTYDGTKARLYVNAGNPIQRTNAAPTWPNYAFTIGDRYTGGYPFHGIIDETRLSSIERSQAWLSTQYNNQNQPATFYTIGAQQILNQPPVLTNPNPTNGSTGIPISLSSLSITIQDPEGDHFNWSITTSPNIGSSSGTQATNGTKTCTVSGLNYATTYTWTVRAYNGHGWTNHSYSFTTQSVNNPPLITNPAPSNRSTGIPVSLSSLSIMIQDPEGDLFNWQITTNPNIGSATGSSAANGTKTCQVSGLLYSTSYSWIVRAYDGHHWTNTTYTFTTQPVNNPPILTNPNPANQSTNVPVSLTSISIIIQDPEGDHFNWSITTSPNIGSNSGAQTTNGTKTCPVSGLSYATTYTWIVRAYDGHHWINKTYLFTTVSNSPPLISNPNPANGSTQIPISLTSLSVTIQDPEGDHFNWQITTNPNIGSASGASATNGTKICPVSGLTYSTTYSWIVRSYDGYHWTNKTYAFTAQPVNNPPIVTSPNPANGSTNVPVSLTSLNVIIQDPEGDHFNWQITTNPNIGSASGTSATNGTKTCPVSGLAYATTYSWIVRAYDGHHWTNKTYTFTTIANNPPVITNPNPVNSSTDIPISLTSLTVTIQDPEGDHFNWQITTNPNIGSASGTSATNGTKTCPVSGLTYLTTYTWIVRVNDGYHWTNRTYFFTTQAINYPPTITNPAPANGSTGIPVTLTQLTVLIQDQEGDHFDWSITTNPNIGSFSGTSATNGTKTCPVSSLSYSTIYAWNVRAYDGHHWTNTTYHFTTIANTPPLISNPSPANGSTNVPISLSSLSVLIQDSEGDHFSWSITTSPNIGSISGVQATNGTKTCPIAGLAYGTTYTWIVRAFDGHHWTNATYTFTTIPNNPPQVTNPTPANGSTNIPVSTSALSITIQDPEGDHFDWTITTNPNIGSASGTSATNGTKTCPVSGLSYSTIYTWTIRAYDGRHWTNKTYLFTTEPINYPPVFSSPAPANESLGVPVTLTSLNIQIQDPEGDHFDWSITTSPNIGSSSGTSATNGTKTCPVSGLTYATTYTWIVRAYDGHHWTNTTYHFTTIANTPPLISNPLPANGSTNVPISLSSLSVLIQDPEGDHFSWSITTSPNIGNNSGAQASNGTKTCPISGLSHATTYSWTVHVYDGYHWTNTTCTFTTVQNTPPLITNTTPVNGTCCPITTSTLCATLQDQEGDPLTWSITTTPDIGTSQGTNEANGTKTCTITGLDYNTYYTWTVCTRDAYHWTNQTNTFTTETNPWPFQQELIINHTKVAGNLTDFPVLVVLTDPHLAAYAQPDGDDIIFTSNTQTRYPHEIESYDNTTGSIIAWVKLPSLSTTTDTTFQIHYGNTTCPPQQNPPQVWDNGYLAVHHLAETTGPAIDSTSHHNNATPYGGLTQQAPGQIGDADTFDGTNDQLRLPQIYTNQTQFTLEAWINAQAADRAIIAQYDNLKGATQQTSTTVTYHVIDGSATSTPLTLNTWTHIAFTYDGLTAHGYTNAIPSTRTMNHPTWPTTRLAIGARPANNSYFKGTIDEVRLSSIPRSQAWITTEYNNQKNPTTFLHIQYTDTDHDGMPDTWETQNGLNPNDPTDATSDLDNDCLSNIREYQNTTDPTSPFSGGKIQAGYTYNSSVNQTNIDTLHAHGLNTIIIKYGLENNINYTSQPDHLPPSIHTFAAIAKTTNITYIQGLNYDHRHFNPNDSIIPGAYPVGYLNGTTGRQVSPFSPAYWHHITNITTSLALLPINHPTDYRLDGIFLDFELYSQGGRPRYWTPDWGYEDQTFQAYIIDRNLTGQNPPINHSQAAERYPWLQTHNLVSDYYLFLATTIQGYAADLRQTIHAINPHFHIGAYPSSIDKSLYLPEIYTGFSSTTHPAVLWATETFDGGRGSIDLPHNLNNFRRPDGSYDLTTIYPSNLSTNTHPIMYYVSGVFLRDYLYPDFAYQTYNLMLNTTGYWAFSVKSFTAPYENISGDYRLLFWDTINHTVRECQNAAEHAACVAFYYANISLARQEIQHRLNDSAYQSPLHHWVFVPPMPDPRVIKTFGTTTRLTAVLLSANTYRGLYAKPESNGYATNISLFSNRDWAAGEEVKCALYYASNRTFYASTKERTTGAAGGKWVTFDFPTPVWVTRDYYYYITVICDDQIGIYYSTRGGPGRMSGTNAYPTWETVGDATAANYNYSIYCTYIEEENLAPTFNGNSPGNDTSQVLLSNRTSITVTDADSDIMTVCFWYSTSDAPYSWTKAQQNNSVVSGTTVRDMSSAWIADYSTEYWWKITAYDGTDNSTSDIYHLWTIPFNIHTTGYYFVSESNGSDASGDGSWGKPYQTIRKATIAARGTGYSVFVRTGTYNGCQFNNAGELTEGTGADWLTLSAMPDASSETGYENVVINRTFADAWDTPPSNGYCGMFYFSDAKKHNIHIRGFTFVNGTLLDYDEADTPDVCAFGIKLSDVCSNFTIEDCYFENITDGAIILYGVEDCIVRNCTLNDVCNYHGKYTAGQEGISVQAASRRCQIYNNTLRLIPKIMIEVKASSSDITIHDNFLNTTQRTNPNGGGIICDAQTTFTNNVTIYNNVIWGNHTGIVMSTEEGGTVKNTTIYNNILNMTGSVVAVYIYSLNKGVGSNLKDNITIKYNTLYGQYYLFWVNTWQRELKNVVFANNILDNNHAAKGINYYNASYSQVTIDTNLFNVSSSSTWGVNSINGSPFFIKKGSDFHLSTSSSPAVDGASDEYTVAVDFDGIARPKGYGYDIGAYEYNSSVHVVLTYPATDIGTTTVTSTGASHTIPASKATGSSMGRQPVMDLLDIRRLWIPSI